MIPNVFDPMCFDEFPDSYDYLRPGYPAALYSDICGLANLRSSSAILEIGSGTGRASEHFLRSGHFVTCIEPGRALICRAAKTLARFDRLQFENTKFEDWNARGRLFSLAISAHAFHWIDAAVSYRLVWSALRQAGALALFWNLFERPPDTLASELESVYKRYAQVLPPWVDGESLKRRRTTELRRCGLFHDHCLREYGHVRTYGAEEFVRLLGTFSSHRELRERPRGALARGLIGAVRSHGGYVAQRFSSYLCLSVRRD